MRASLWGAAFIVAALLSARFARAQQGLPPLPAPTAEPSAPPPPAQAPAPAPVVAPAPRQYVYVPPPQGPAAYSNAERKYAPKYSLWLGGSLGVLGYGGGLYTNDASPPPGNPGIETTGNFVRNGLAIQADIGARLARRYIPYLTLEVGLMGAGHRFEGTSTHALTTFVGVGFRFLAGDVDSTSFAGDIALGVRKFQLSNASGTWSISGLEIFRLGFGADVRVSSSVTFTPMITLSGGTLTDTSGTVNFAPNQSDGQSVPSATDSTGRVVPFTGNQGIPAAYQQTYLAIVLGCGVHFDLFGK
jgi:hypothetical protein